MLQLSGSFPNSPSLGATVRIDGGALGTIVSSGTNLKALEEAAVKAGDTLKAADW
jgi:hypothetical protein